MSSQTNIRNAIFDQRSTRPPEVGVSRWHRHTHIHTDMATLWPTRPSGDELVKIQQQFFPPLFSKFWSKLEASIRNDFDIIYFKDKLKCTFKPRRQKHFNCGEKLANSLLCRMQIGRSYLKSHGFAINLSSSDRCMCGAVDDNKHLLLFCFVFQEERQTML